MKSYYAHLPFYFLLVCRITLRKQEEIENAIANGFETFITGMDKEAELIFAQLVIEKKEQYPYLFLEAALAYLLLFGPISLQIIGAKGKG